MRVVLSGQERIMNAVKTDVIIPAYHPVPGAERKRPNQQLLQHISGVPGRQRNLQLFLHRNRSQEPVLYVPKKKQRIQEAN